MMGRGLCVNWSILPAGKPAGKPPAGKPPAGKPPAGKPPAGTPPAGKPPAGQPAGNVCSKKSSSYNR
jgi:hypothetical protein